MVLTVAAIGLSPPLRAQFATGVQLVEVYASVTRPDGTAVTGLTASDFEVREDGRGAARLRVRGRGVSPDSGARRGPQLQHGGGAAAPGDARLPGVPARVEAAGPRDGVGNRRRRRSDCATRRAARRAAARAGEADSVEHHRAPRQRDRGAGSPGARTRPSGPGALHRRCRSLQPCFGGRRARAGAAQQRARVRHRRREDTCTDSG